MKKFLVLFLFLALIGDFTMTTCYASNYTPRKAYKLNQYDSQGRKTGYTKVYYQGDKQNVKRVEKYSTSGKRIEVYR